MEVARMTAPATRIIVVDDPTAVAEETAARIAEAARSRVRASGRFTLALAGGTTPKKAYELLAERPDVPWGAIDFYFGDERAVSHDDPESNYRMARESLFDRQSIEEGRIFRMRGEMPDLDAAARDYEAVLPDALDFVLLGMGEDGHTASLFPGLPAALETERRVVAVTGAPKPPPRRLTLAPKALRTAREVVVIVTGGAKAAVLAKVLAGPLDVGALPVQIALGVTFIVDQAAAAALPAEKRS
ncbi:MAG: 6-phosphogluconolactonase [Polyangiaceae bacterium]|nr:6-phosphogluconolactonase [Polyangiaceae bacterium]